MFARILHANDGSKHALQSLRLALGIARQNHSEIHTVCVEEIPYMSELMEDVHEARGAVAGRIEAILIQSRSMAEEYQVKLHTHVIAGHPVRDIVTLAADLEADLLVIGARGHSALYERMLGSRADRITQLAPCPVLIVKPAADKTLDPTFGKILHAIDGSTHSFQALTIALALAKQNNSELHTVCVEEVPYPERGEVTRAPTPEVAARIEGVLQRAHALAEKLQVESPYPRHRGASGTRGRQACS